MDPKLSVLASSDQMSSGTCQCLPGSTSVQPQHLLAFPTLDVLCSMPMLSSSLSMDALPVLMLKQVLRRKISISSPGRGPAEAGKTSSSGPQDEIPFGSPGNFARGSSMLVFKSHVGALCHALGET